MKLLFDDRNQHIGGYGAPDLRLHRIFAGAQKTLDAQVLLDPFEEQFHLPAILVKCGNGQRRQARVVGQKYQRLARIGVFEADAPDMFGIAFGHVKAVQRDGLIADNPFCSVGLGRIHAMRVQVALGAGHKESPGLMQRIEPRVVQIAAIHDVESPRLDGQDVEHVDIAQLAVADVDEGGDVAAQVEQGVHLHRRLGAAKRRPVEHRQTQVDGGGIEGVNGCVEFEAEWLLAIELAGAANEHCCHIRPDAPIASLVGIGQRGSLDRGVESHSIEPGLVGRQTDFDIAQAFAPSQLREGHGAKLLGAGERSRALVASITRHNACKARPRYKLHQLRKQGFANMHGHLQSVENSGNYQKNEIRVSNRHQIKSLSKPLQYWLYRKLARI